MPAEGAPAFDARGSLARLLAARVAERPEHPFLWVEEDGPWTLAALAAQAADIRERLAATGAVAGDRVLLRIGNDAASSPPWSGRGWPASCPSSCTPRRRAAEAAEVAAAMEARGGGRDRRRSRTRRRRLRRAPSP